MSLNTVNLPLRLFCDIANQANVLDLNRNEAAYFYAGDDLEIDIGLGENGALNTTITQLASLTCQLFVGAGDTNPAMMAAANTGAINTALTQAQWTNNTTPFYHAAFLFTGAQTSVLAAGVASASLWLRITGTTSQTPAQTVTVLDGPITVKNGPNSSVSAPTPAFLRFKTVGGNMVPQLYDPVSAAYYNLEIDTVNGIRTLSLGDTPYS